MLSSSNQFKLFVVVTSRSRITAAVPAVSVLVKANHRSLSCDAFRVEPRAFDRSNSLFSRLKISRLHHHFVVIQIEIAMKQRHAESR
jgi:hypothetical protein